MNTLKTVILMAGMTVLLVFVGKWIGGQGGMVIAFMIALAMNFVSYWFSDKIVLRMYGAKEVQYGDAPELFSLVQELATRAGLPMPRVYIIENAQPNAFATGRNPEHGAVAVTTGLMRIMNRQELSGVIAHELGHIRNRDILIGTVAATIAGAISMIANMAQWAMIFGGRSDDEEGGSNPIGALLMIILAPIAAMLIQMAISRSREYLADESGAQISGNPMFLAGALKKLQVASERIPMDANPTTAHMFIVSPLSGKGFAGLFSTHPPVEKRIERLQGLTVTGF